MHILFANESKGVVSSQSFLVKAFHLNANTTYLTGHMMTYRLNPF